MEAIRRRNADWEHEEILQLIELLKNNPEIWDPNHESYHHHQRRKLILKSIAKTLGKNTRTVEMKLKSLRTSYTRMHSKIQDEIKRNGSYNGHIWFGYEAMNFLSKIFEKKTEKEGTRRVEDTLDDGNQVECSGDESEDEFPARKIYNASWKYSQLLELIDLYKEHSILWDTNHVNYHHKHMKINAIKSIAEKLQKTGPEVKTKIKSLKTIFLRIDKKVKDDIQKNGKITCKLWFGYKRMSFLDPECSKICEMYISKPNCDIKTSKETNNNSDEDDDDEEERNDKNFSWTLETTVELMQMYKNHPQIWDPEHDGSNNRLIRNEVINLFAKTFDTNKYEIEKKLKTLRSQFLRQHKVVVSSVKDGTKKPTKLWFGYKYMSFLAKIYDDEYDDDQEENVTTEIKQELTMDSDTSVMSEDTSLHQSHKERKRKCNDNSDHDPLLEMKINKQEHVELNIESGHNCSASDEYTAFGQFVAQELKKIKDEYALMMAKNEISTLIFKAQMHQANKK